MAVARIFQQEGPAMQRLVVAALACAVAAGAPAAGIAETAGGETASTAPRDPPRQDIEEVRAELQALRQRVESLETSLAGTLQAFHVPELPASMEFAGQLVPLDRWDVAERLEREFLLSLGSRAQVVLWLKRSARYFPYIEGELRRTGLPDDLKYVAVIESSLLPTAYSHAQALGIWQFIAPTARRYGLAVEAEWDERRNPERSTAAALAYLQDLHAQFRDWPLALAAYNTGEQRIEQALRRQGVPTYYQLALSSETERYVFRAFAAKLILADPARYGFEVPAERRYRPHVTETLEINVRDRMAVVDLARAAGSYYRELRELNPEIAQDYLPKGRYLVRVPPGRAPRLAGDRPPKPR
jgi:peptidoglycan lytic transglycosylase D